MPQRRAFTLIELLVVVAIIAALIAILLPSLNKARRVSRRAVCGSNLKQISTAAFTYAAGNRGEFFICRGRRVQIAFSQAIAGQGNRAGDFDVDWIKALETVSLVEPDGSDLGDGATFRPVPSKVWDCPSRDFRSQWETLVGLDQIVIGYQYYGGIDTWLTPTGSFPSLSPTSLASSRPGYLLGADTTMRIDLAWGGGRNTAYQGMPSHAAEAGENPGISATYRDGAPAGGNQAFADGSVQWIEFRDMVRIHSWGGESRKAYGYLDDYGSYVPPANPFF